MLTLAECQGAPKMCSACTWQALTPEFTVANGPTGPHNSSSWKCITIHKGRRMDLCGQSAQRSQGNEVKTAQVTAPQPDTHLDTSRSATDACIILQHFGWLVREACSSSEGSVRAHLTLDGDNMITRTGLSQPAELLELGRKLELNKGVSSATPSPLSQGLCMTPLPSCSLTTKGQQQPTANSSRLTAHSHSFTLTPAASVSDSQAARDNTVAATSSVTAKRGECV